MHGTGLFRKNMKLFMDNLAILMLINIFEMRRIQNTILDFESHKWKENFDPKNAKNPNFGDKLSKEIRSHIKELDNLIRPRSITSNFINASMNNSFILASQLFTTQVLSEAFRYKNVKNLMDKSDDEKLAFQVISKVGASILSSGLFIPLDTLRINYNIQVMQAGYSKINAKQFFKNLYPKLIESKGKVLFSGGLTTFLHSLAF